MFRDDRLARDIPPGLYVGHVRVGSAYARVTHDEHAPLTLPRGTYRVRRQRELGPGTRASLPTEHQALAPEQTAALAAIVRGGLPSVGRTEPADRGAAEEGVRLAYRAAGLKPPSPPGVV